MIRFTCPRCKALLDAADGSAGLKLHCGLCGQRLQVPAPPSPPPAPINKTVLGTFSEESLPPPTSMKPVPDRAKDASNPAEEIEYAESANKVPRRHRVPPARRSRGPLMIAAVVLPVLLVTICVGIAGVVIFSVPRTPPVPPNAHCPNCGHAFHMNTHGLTGSNNLRVLQDRECPQCGIHFPALLFLQEGGQKGLQPIQGGLPQLPKE
jgi:transcription elongation factor Elf1